LLKAIPQMDRHTNSYHSAYTLILALHKVVNLAPCLFEMALYDSTTCIKASNVVGLSFTTHLAARAPINGQVLYCSFVLGYRLKDNLLHLCHCSLLGSRFARHVLIKTLASPVLHIFLREKFSLHPRTIAKVRFSIFKYKTG
jgi:hypothetical protein